VARAGHSDDPRAWLVAVANRRLVDAWRSESAPARPERTVSISSRADDPARQRTDDDTLELLVLCCHPPSRRRRSSR
jgi:predicted RNA polymerase sigma factor